jgi:hypothetical protein
LNWLDNQPIHPDDQRVSQPKQFNGNYITAHHSTSHQHSRSDCVKEDEKKSVNLQRIGHRWRRIMLQPTARKLGCKVSCKPRWVKNYLHVQLSPVTVEKPRRTP